MVVAHVALLLTALSLPQEPPRRDVETGEVGKFRWPPAAPKTLRYRATLTKVRRLSSTTVKAEKVARKAARLYAGRPPKQQVQMAIDVSLAIKKDSVDATYRTTLTKQSLRLRIQKPGKTDRNPKTGVQPAATSKQVAFLGNDKVPLLWGLPDQKNSKKLAVPQAAVDRMFHHTFQKRDKKGTEPDSMHLRYGDHLLPLIWTYPLPCWLGELVNVLDLDGEAVIGGKTLIRDGTQRMKLGSRNSRVTLKWTKAAANSFTMTYTIQVEQYVSERRDGKPSETRSWIWLFDVQGEARYSFKDQAWEQITERVKARPKEMTPQLLRGLRDEVFEGTIKIVRQGSSSKRRRR